MKLKTLGIFAAGLILGSAGGYFVTKEAMKTKNQAELEDMRDYYMQKYGHKDAADVGKDKDYDKYGTKIVTTGKNGLESKDKINLIMTDYHTESDVVNEEKENNKSILKEALAKPYEITEDEYESSNNEKVEYMWYYQDRTLAYFTVESGIKEYHAVDNPYVQLGADNLTTLEESASGIIYIRNDKLKTDYFVELKSGPIPETADYSDDDDDDEDI